MLIARVMHYESTLENIEYLRRLLSQQIEGQSVVLYPHCIFPACPVLRKSLFQSQYEMVLLIVDVVLLYFIVIGNKFI